MKKSMVGVAAVLAAAVVIAGVVRDRIPKTGEIQSGERKQERKGESSGSPEKTQASAEADSHKELQENQVRDFEGTKVSSGGESGTAQEPVFESSEITEEIFSRMYGKSYKEDCTVPREELRYLTISHYGFDGEVHTGEMVVNKGIAEDTLDIFRELYEIQYPIEQMRLIDDYDADDERSMADNNSSAFNYRVISGTTKLSNHSRGLAIDINPLYNPYVHTNTGTESCEPANAAPYVDRSLPFDYKIDEADACCRIFTEHGFSWGGNWTRSKDYQHFEKTDPK